MQDDPESAPVYRKYFLALIAAGAITWVIGLCIGGLLPLILGGSLAVAGLCGWLGRFD